MKIMFLFLALGAVLRCMSLPKLLAQTPAAGPPSASAAPILLSLPQTIDYALKNKPT